MLEGSRARFSWGTLPYATPHAFILWLAMWKKSVISVARDVLHSRELLVVVRNKPKPQNWNSNLSVTFNASQVK